MIGAMATRDLGVRPKPSYLVLWTALGCLSLQALAWLLWGWLAFLVVWLLSWPAIMLAGCVAAVALAAWKHRQQVFTHLKENADPQPMHLVKGDTFYSSRDGTVHQMQKRWLAEQLNADQNER